MHGTASADAAAEQPASLHRYIGLDGCAAPLVRDMQDIIEIMT